MAFSEKGQSSGQSPSQKSGSAQKPDPFKKPAFLERPSFLPQRRPASQADFSQKPSKPGLFSWLRPLAAPIPKKAPGSGLSGAGSPVKGSPKTGGSLFSEKKDWKRTDFLSKTAKAPFSARGKMPSSFYDRKKMLNEALSPKRFSTYISEREVKTRLKELRKEEYQAKNGQEKSKLSGLRKYLEKQTDLKGKY